MKQAADSFRLASSWSRVALLAVLILLPGSATQAQEFRSVITGQVTDPSGALIRNATVTAVNVDS